MLVVLVVEVEPPLETQESDDNKLIILFLNRINNDGTAYACVETIEDKNIFVIEQVLSS